MLKKLPGRIGPRFVLLFSAVTVPLLLMLFGAGYYAKHVVLTQVSNSYQNMVDSNLHMIDRSLEDIVTNMVYMVEHDENFQKFGRTGLSETDQYFIKAELAQRNTAYQSYYHTVDMFYVYSKPNDVLVTSYMAGASEGDMDRVRSWVSGLLHRSEDLTDLYYKWNIIRIGEQYYLHRIVSNEPGNNAFIGALININTLKQPLGSLNVKAGDIVFAGDDGTVLSASSVLSSGRNNLPVEKLASNDSFFLKDKGKKLFVIAGQSNQHGIRMAIILPSSELMKGLNAFQTVTGLLPIVVLCILLVYIYLFRSMIYKPILQLLAVIRRIKEGDMEAKLPDSRFMEFDTINKTFNSMIGEITDLKIDVYEEKLNAKNAELKHLQTQINPHFFLNTLNIIYQLADMKQFELVKTSVRHMVQYFRFMLHTKDTITLGQELEHIRNYLSIQKMRYQDLFSFEIELPGELEDFPLPSLTVQPFVENAMIHGLSVKTSPFRLEIRVSRTDEVPRRVVIEVSDNGKGVHPEQLENLNSDLTPPSSEGTHIGIWNVKKRIFMRYGSAARLRFHTNAPKGLCVVLSLPDDENGKELPGDGRNADRG